MAVANQKHTFEFNQQWLYEIDITPLNVDHTWARLGAGISSMAPSTNESIDQTAYLDGDGYGSSAVIGAQLTYSCSGHRVVGDPAQDYIGSLEFLLGNARTTFARVTRADGEQRVGEVTIANVTLGGGDAASKTEISFEVHFNGKPERIPPVPAPALDATWAQGTKPGTVTATVTVPDGMRLGYVISSAPLSANLNSYPGYYTDYASGLDILVDHTMYVNLYMVDKYNRVSEFVAHQVT